MYDYNPIFTLFLSLFPCWPTGLASSCLCVLSCASSFLELFHEVILVTTEVTWASPPCTRSGGTLWLGVVGLRMSECLFCSLLRHHAASPHVRVSIYQEIHITPHMALIPRAQPGTGWLAGQGAGSLLTLPNSSWSLCHGGLGFAGAPLPLPLTQHAVRDSKSLGYYY